MVDSFRDWVKSGSFLFAIFVQDYLNTAIAMRNRQRPPSKINASIHVGFSRGPQKYYPAQLKSN